MTWEERMAERHRRHHKELFKEQQMKNEIDFPKEKADASAALMCQDCVEVRQEFGRWMVFGICGVDCLHKHHENDGVGYA